MCTLTSYIHTYTYIYIYTHVHTLVYTQVDAYVYVHFVLNELAPVIMGTASLKSVGRASSLKTQAGVHAAVLKGESLVSL